MGRRAATITARRPCVKPELRVEVRCRFDGTWVSGFEVVEQDDHFGPARQGQYRLRRTSDGVVLPALFPAGDIRPSPRQPEPEPAA
jgi:hypothetical protein